MKLGDLYEGEKINEINYLDGEIMSYGTNNAVAWVKSVIVKHTEALKSAIKTWKKRKDEHAKWHLDYLELKLQEELDWLKN